MQDAEDTAGGFASPLGPDPSRDVRRLSLGRYGSARRRIAQDLRTQGDADASSALEDFQIGGKSLWRPEVGLADAFQQRGATQVAALQAAAACATSGGQGAVSAVLDAASPVYLDGWMAPCAGETRLEADGREIRLTSQTGDFRLTQQGARWILDNAAGSVWPVVDGGGLAPRYIIESGILAGTEGFPWLEEALSRREEASSSRADVIRSAWGIVMTSSRYGLWVARVLAGCLLVHRQERWEGESGSASDYPGLIHIAPPANPIVCGELLVHECSHQYLLIYASAGPLSRPGEAGRIFSPIKGAERTVEQTLFAAHAVANMLIYYTDLKKSGMSDPIVKRQLERYSSWFFEDYGPSLDDAGGLTDRGLAFWSGLRQATESVLENTHG